MIIMITIMMIITIMVKMMMTAAPESKEGHDKDQGLGGFPVAPIVVH